MKNLIKIIFIGIVIFGLVATYMNFGGTGSVAQPGPQQANTESAVQGPTNLPPTN